MILSRLESNIENMSYLYQTFISSFSLENFNFYIRKSLGDVLKTFSNRIFYQNFLLSLSNYDNMLQNKNSEDFKPLPQNIFELSFYAKDQKTQSPTFISIGYNFQYENLTNNLLLNPWNADIHALKIENSLKGSIDEYLPSISENSPHKIAYNFFINKNYQLLLDNIKSDFYLIMNDMPNLPGLNDEDIGEASFLEEKKKFVDLFLKNPVSLDFKDNKKVMAFIYDFLKPHREKLASLINKTSFDRRLERFALHANEELKKFAEARENWVYGVVNEQMIKKGEVKKGFHWIRKWGRLYAIRVDKNGKITPAMISKQVMLKTLYPKVNRWVHRRKKKKSNKKINLSY